LDERTNLRILFIFQLRGDHVICLAVYGNGNKIQLIQSEALIAENFRLCFANATKRRV
jgi:hypothetical protein